MWEGMKKKHIKVHFFTSHSAVFSPQNEPNVTCYQHSGHAGRVNKLNVIKGTLSDLGVCEFGTIAHLAGANDPSPTQAKDRIVDGSSRIQLCYRVRYGREWWPLQCRNGMQSAPWH